MSSLRSHAAEGRKVRPRGGEGSGEPSRATDQDAVRSADGTQRRNVTPTVAIAPGGITTVICRLKARALSTVLRPVHAFTIRRRRHGVAERDVPDGWEVRTSRRLKRVLSTAYSPNLKYE